MEIFVYSNGSDAVEEGFSAAELPELLADKDNLIWVDFEAPTVEDEKILSDVFHFHPLTIEDARETRNHPKIEAFKDYIFFIVHGIKNETNSHNFVTKELDGYLGRNYLVTYHHESFRSIDSVKRQICSHPYSCQRGVDYLLHQILDQMIDLYIPIVEDFDEAIDEMEERIFRLKRGNNKVLEEIMDLKRSVARLIRISSKQANVLYRLSHGEFRQIEESHLPFYRDVHDHLMRILLLAESYRDLVNGLLDLHFSVIANRTNDVMKILAIFSAVVLPLSLIAGIYGMNFENIPEIHSPYGYYVTLAVMLLVAVGLLVYFWRKGWIFERKDTE